MLQYNYRTPAPATRRTRPCDDQEWVVYDPIVNRPPLRWPNGARVALWICPAILDYEFVPPANPWLDPWARTPPPDVLGYSRQEYGNRVGFWRLLKLVDQYKLRPTAVANVEALRRYPEITEAISDRKWDVLGHGMSNTRFIYDYDRKEELNYYREMLETVEALTGVQMKGMGGPGPQSGTEDTPDLLAEVGFVYHADWFMDDQPFPIRARTGKLIAMPYSIEMNDVSALATFETDEFVENAKRQFDRLYQEGLESGRVMCISLHPSLIGQPQRINYLENLFGYISSFSEVWHATGAEIAEYYMAHYYDAEVSRLRIANPVGQL